MTMDRDKADLQHKRTAAHIMKGEYAQAARELSDAIKYYPEDPSLHESLAVCYRALGDEASANSATIKAQELIRQAAERWSPTWGPPLSVFWKGQLVGHFEGWPGDNDYPRINGKWTPLESALTKQFEAILLRDDYWDRPAPLRVRLGADPGGDCLVDCLVFEKIVGPTGKDFSCYTIVLSPGVPPGIGEG